MLTFETHPAGYDLPAGTAAGRRRHIYTRRRISAKRCMAIVVARNAHHGRRTRRGRIIRILERQQLARRPIRPRSRRYGFVVPLIAGADDIPFRRARVEARRRARWSPSTDTWVDYHAGAIGRVADVLGNIDAPCADTGIIRVRHPDAHSPEAVAEATAMGGGVTDGHSAAAQTSRRADGDDFGGARFFDGIDRQIASGLSGSACTRHVAIRVEAAR